jgi:hypothetical protein
MLSRWNNKKEKSLPRKIDRRLLLQVSARDVLDRLLVDDAERRCHLIADGVLGGFGIQRFSTNEFGSGPR